MDDIELVEVSKKHEQQAMAYSHSAWDRMDQYILML